MLFPLLMTITSGVTLVFAVSMAPRGNCNGFGGKPARRPRLFRMGFLWEAHPRMTWFAILRHGESPHLGCGWSHGKIRRIEKNRWSPFGGPFQETSNDILQVSFPVHGHGHVRSPYVQLAHGTRSRWRGINNEKHRWTAGYQAFDPYICCRSTSKTGSYRVKSIFSSYHQLVISWTISNLDKFPIQNSFQMARDDFPMAIYPTNGWLWTIISENIPLPTLLFTQMAFEGFFGPDGILVLSGCFKTSCAYSYCGWLRNPINHQKDGWNAMNNGMFTIQQLVQDFATTHSSSLSGLDLVSLCFSMLLLHAMFQRIIFITTIHQFGPFFSGLGLSSRNQTTGKSIT